MFLIWQACLSARSSSGLTRDPLREKALVSD